MEEVAYIEQFVKSANHLVLISPRRFGKSSVVAKAVKQTGRKHITVNLQQATSVSDLSAKLLKEFFKVHPSVNPYELYYDGKIVKASKVSIPDSLRGEAYP